MAESVLFYIRLLVPSRYTIGQWPRVFLENVFGEDDYNSNVFLDKSRILELNYCFDEKESFCADKISNSGELAILNKLIRVHKWKN